VQGTLDCSRMTLAGGPVTGETASVASGGTSPFVGRARSLRVGQALPPARCQYSSMTLHRCARTEIHLVFKLLREFLDHVSFTFLVGYDSVALKKRAKQVWILQST